MSDCRHEWSTGWDGYVCTACGSERSFSDDELATVVVYRGVEERMVVALLDAYRGKDAE